MRALLCCALLALGAGAHAVEGKGVKATLSSLPGDVRGVVFSPDNKFLAISTGQAIKVFDWQTGKEVASVPGGLGATFSPDGQLLAYPGQDEYNNDGLMAWDIAAGKKRVFIADDNVISPVFSPSGTQIAAAVGSRIKLYDVAAGKEVAVVPNAHKVSITALIFVQDGKRLVSADARGGSALWDMTESVPKKVSDFNRAGDETAINSLAATRSGSRVALATGGGEIVILDSAKLTLLGAMKAHPQNLTVKGVAYHPDNNMLASASSGVEDLEIKLWDSQNLKPIFAFTGHTGGVNCVAFSPDGKWLASGSDDKSVKIWEVAALIQQSIPPPPKPKKVVE